MRIIFILLTTLVIASSCSGIKRLQKGEQLSVNPASLILVAEGDDNPVMDVDFELVIPADYIKGSTQVIYQPQFVNTSNIYDLQPVVINSKRTARKEKRDIKKGEEIMLPSAVRVVSHDKPISVDYDLLIPLKDWMPDAELVGWTVFKCCDDTYTVYDRDLIAAGVVVEEKVQKPAFKEVVTEVVSNVALQESIFFTINNDTIDMTIDSNAKSIELTKRLLCDINNNKSLKLNGITLVGSASPDGTGKINKKISKERADIVAKMLASKLGVSPDMIKTSSTGANWSGFCELVSKSSLSNKSKVLDIASSSKSDWAKTLELRKLPNFDVIKSDILPKLRNVSCSVNFEKISEVVEMVKM